MDRASPMKLVCHTAGIARPEAAVYGRTRVRTSFRSGHRRLEVVCTCACMFRCRALQACCARGNACTFTRTLVNRTEGNVRGSVSEFFGKQRSKFEDFWDLCTLSASAQSCTEQIAGTGSLYCAAVSRTTVIGYGHVSPLRAASSAAAAGPNHKLRSTGSLQHCRARPYARLRKAINDGSCAARELRVARTNLRRLVLAAATCCNSNVSEFHTTQCIPPANFIDTHYITLDNTVDPNLSL